MMQSVYDCDGVQVTWSPWDRPRSGQGQWWQAPEPRSGSPGRGSQPPRGVAARRPGAQVYTIIKCSVPADKSDERERWLLSLICSRRSFTESALRSASSYVTRLFSYRSNNA